MGHGNFPYCLLGEGSRLRLLTGRRMLFSLSGLSSHVWSGPHCALPPRALQLQASSQHGACACVCLFIYIVDEVLLFAKLCLFKSHKCAQIQFEGITLQPAANKTKYESSKLSSVEIKNVPGMFCPFMLLAEHATMCTQYSEDTHKHAIFRWKNCHKPRLKREEIKTQNWEKKRKAVQKHPLSRCNPPCPNYIGLEETED